MLFGDMEESEANSAKLAGRRIYGGNIIRPNVEPLRLTMRAALKGHHPRAYS